MNYNDKLQNPVHITVPTTIIDIVTVVVITSVKEVMFSSLFVCLFVC